jgi:hypothetical protein
MVNSPRSAEMIAVDPGKLEALFSNLYGMQREKIRAHAHRLYLERGATDGQALNDWLQAERELFGPAHG